MSKRNPQQFSFLLKHANGNAQLDMNITQNPALILSGVSAGSVCKCNGAGYAFMPLAILTTEPCLNVTV